MQDTFLEDAHRILIAGGELRVVTDHDDLWAWDCEHFARWTSPEHATPYERRDFQPPEGAGEGVHGHGKRSGHVKNGWPGF